MQQPSFEGSAGSGASLWRRLLGEPLVQFLLLGGLIFLLYAATRLGDGGGSSADGSTARGQPDRRIVITPAQIEDLKAHYRLSWKRDPGPEELGDQLESFVHEEILYREGLALGLDRDDVVVRRRTIEKMTALARPQNPAADATREQLRAWYQRYPHRFREAGRLSFEQRFFDPKKRANAAADVRSALEALAADDRADASALGPADEFVLPALTLQKTELQIAHLYGEAFLTALLATPLRSWTGPMTSPFGQHAVYVVDRQPARMPGFEEVERHVRADWLTVNNRGTKSAAEALLPQYQIELQGPQARSLAKAAAVAPLLERR